MKLFERKSKLLVLVLVCLLGVMAFGATIAYAEEEEEPETKKIQNLDYTNVRVSNYCTPIEELIIGEVYIPNISGNDIENNSLDDYQYQELVDISEEGVYTFVLYNKGVMREVRSYNLEGDLAVIEWYLVTPAGPRTHTLDTHNSFFYGTDSKTWCDYAEDSYCEFEVGDILEAGMYFDGIYDSETAYLDGKIMVFGQEFEKDVKVVELDNTNGVIKFETIVEEEPEKEPEKEPEESKQESNVVSNTESKTSNAKDTAPATGDNMVVIFLLAATVACGLVAMKINKKEV